MVCVKRLIVTALSRAASSRPVTLLSALLSCVGDVESWRRQEAGARSYLSLQDPSSCELVGRESTECVLMCVCVNNTQSWTTSGTRVSLRGVMMCDSSGAVFEPKPPFVRPLSEFVHKITTRVHRVVGEYLSFPCAGLNLNQISCCQTGQKLDLPEQ